MTKLQATLPKGDRNGLAVHTDTFVADPTRLHVIIAIVHTGRLTTDTDTGDTVPQLRIDRVERVLPEDASALEGIVRKAVEHRHGAGTLPLDIKDEIAHAFESAAIDEHTGETHA